MKICFATNNKNKVAEISALLPNEFEVLSLGEVGCAEELPENQMTLAGNSLEKAQYLYDNYKINCFADDTGLEVEALDGAPGVYSARFAGEQRNSEDNMLLLLEKLANKKNRKAQFRTVITLIVDGKIKQFEGVAKGQISKGKSGEKGFGYDPIFIPEGFSKSFAEMSSAEKNNVSHRAKAIKKLIQYFSNGL